MSKEQKVQVDPTNSFIAGAVAGAIEGSVTYPFEFAKTRLQLASKADTVTRNPIKLLYQISRSQGLGALYVGCPVFIVGNTAKASIRFLGFDMIKDLLKDPNTGEVSGFRGVLAGLGAGFLESVFAVTPFEHVKTLMIDDKRSANPKYSNNGKGVFRNYGNLLRTEGLTGLYSGVIPVSMRQAANSAVRLGCYNKIKTLVQKYTNTDVNTPLSSGLTFVVGAFSGVVTVYSTMPIDTIKTRMQSLEHSKYKNTLDCFVQVYKKEGVKNFWKGATPRLGRLILSGGIVFTVYEKVLVILK